MGTIDELPIQSGAVPTRKETDGSVQVLLVQAKGSKRWIIPKGWPKPDKALAQSAAEEAFEEAGVRGTIDSRPLGTFHYEKNVGPADIEVLVIVHWLPVDDELADYPEAGDRKRKWLSAEEAANKVDSEELGSLIMQAAERAR